MRKQGTRRPRSLRDARLARVRRLAAGQEGVVSRRQLYSLGITRAEVRAHVRAGRWQRLHTQSVCVHTTQVTDAGSWWAALFEAGPGACLDGETSLVASGLEHYEPATIRVSVRKGSRVRRARGITIRETRRWRATDRAPSGIPRSRVEVAAVRAALWAVSDKQTALLLTLVVQQGLTTAEHLGREMLSIKQTSVGGSSTR